MKLDDCQTVKMIEEIVKRYEEDLKADTLQTRDSYYQIKAFHYDSIAKLIHRKGEDK